MPLVIAALRLGMLFLNIYESFKTLKVPPPSARGGGQPSARALAQRKRNMKGCMSVWIVWCCFATYERLLEAIVCMFIPFYWEIKALVLLFLILTRARGAEPIFLHIIRPLIKPHTSTLDPLLDLICMIGDILFLSTTFPFRYAFSWWQHTFGHSETVLDSEIDQSANGTPLEPGTSDVSDAARNPNPQVLANPPLPSLRKQPNSLGVAAAAPRRPAETRHASATVRSRRQALEGIDPQTQTKRQVSDPSSQSQSTQPMPQSLYKIWHPPPSAYEAHEQESRNSPIDQSTPPRAPFQDNSAVQEEINEWRKYPAFPSAYPATPLVWTSQLPTHRPIPTNIAASTSRRISDNIQFSSIPENAVDNGLERQDFRRSLLPPREPLNPGFLRSLSDDDDEDRTFGIQNNGNDEEMSVDDEENEADGENDMDEDDDFDVTLKTPLLRRVLPTRSSHLIPSISISSSSSHTGLTTLDNGSSSLRTRTVSESSASISISDSSSVAGRKRAFSRSNAATDTRSKVKAFGERMSKNPPRGRTMLRPPKPLSKHSQRSANHPSKGLKPIESSTGEEDDLEDSESLSDAGGDSSDRDPPEMKKRKLATPPIDASVQVARTSKSTKSGPTRTQQAKSLEIPPRTSSRLRVSAAPLRTGGIPTRRIAISASVPVAASSSESSSQNNPPRSAASVPGPLRRANQRPAALKKE